MIKTRRSIAFGLGILLMATLAFRAAATTAGISSLKLAKDKSASEETSNFGTSDTIYAVAEISDTQGKLKVAARLVIEDVPGQQSGPIPGLEKTIDMDHKDTATFTFSAPTNGWPQGKYRVEVVMGTDDGDLKDQKAASFTVS